MEKKYIIIDDVKIYHGDKISAVVKYCDEDYEIEDARLCINSLETNSSHEFHKLFICQNECDGDSSAENKFEYRYSWNFKVNQECKICSEDTMSIKLKELEDDDPMPADWVCEEKIPNDL